MILKATVEFTFPNASTDIEETKSWLQRYLKNFFASNVIIEVKPETVVIEL